MRIANKFPKSLVFFVLFLSTDFLLDTNRVDRGLILSQGWTPIVAYDLLCAVLLLRN